MLKSTLTPKSPIVGAILVGVTLMIGGPQVTAAQPWCPGNPVPPCDPADPSSGCYQPPLPGPKCEPEECDKCRKSPCYVASGVYVTEAVDLEIPTPGFPLRVARRYQGALHVDGPMGPGWSSNLTARLYDTTYLFAAPDTYQREAIIVMPDGARYRFRDGGDGTYTPPAGRYDTLVRNADGTFDLFLQHSRSIFRFNADGSIAWMMDDYGNALSFTYDANGRLLRVADTAGSGRYLDVYWGANGRLSAVADHTGRTIQYGYSAEGMLTSVTDPLGRVTHYSYVAGKYRPLPSEIRDHWGRIITTITYDAQDRVTSYTEEGEIYSYDYAYDGNPNQTAKTDSLGNTWVYPFGDGGLVADAIPPAGSGGGTKHTTYNADGTIQATTDEVGVDTSFTYDTGGRLLTVSLDAGGPSAVRFEYAYDPSFPDQVVSVTPVDPATGTRDPDWQAWEYDYYPEGSPAPGALHHVVRVRADGMTRDTLMTYEYDAQGRPTATTDAAGSRTESVYDAQGNLVTVHAPANNEAGTRPETHYGYDALGRIVSVTDPLGKVTTYTHDAVGRRLTMTWPPPAPGSPLDFTTTYTYDQFDPATGLLFTVATDPNGHVTKQGYDQYGRLVESHDALGAVTRYGYAHGLLASITDAHGYNTSYVYDALRRLQQTAFPDGAVESYTFWADGLLQSKTDRKGQTIDYAYDPLKRLATKTYPDGTSITYTYQGQKLTQVHDTSTDPDETHTFVYDGAYRVISNTQGPRGTIDYTYTATDELASYSVVGGATATYTYFPDQSLHTITWSPVAGEFEYSYTPRSQYDTVTFPNGQQRLYSYDDQGRLLELANVHPTAGNLATYAYGYDTNYFTGTATMLGQRTSMTANVPAQGFVDALTKYSYDAAYQLVRADYPPGEPFHGEIHEWTYDLLGNRLTNTVNGVTDVYTYQKLGTNLNNWQRLLSDGVNTYTYDANGNTVSRTSPAEAYTFTLDPENLVTTIASTATASLAYDSRGRRTGLSTAQGSDEYLYMRFNPVVVNGNTASQMLFGPGIDQPLASAGAVGLRYFVLDGMGSVMLIDDDSGAVTGSSVYDAWGVHYELLEADAPRFFYTAREESLGPIWFYRARHYAPGIGRFLSEDPAGWVFRDYLSWDPAVPFTAQGDHFLYTGNYPVARRDPRGEDWRDWWPKICRWAEDATCFYWMVVCVDFGRECRERLGPDSPSTPEWVKKRSGEPGRGTWGGPRWYCYDENPKCTKMLVDCGLLASTGGWPW